MTPVLVPVDPAATCYRCGSLLSQDSAGDWLPPDLVRGWSGAGGRLYCSQRHAVAGAWPDVYRLARESGGSALADRLDRLFGHYYGPAGEPPRAGFARSQRAGRAFDVMLAALRIADAGELGYRA